jgi:hypothetical protein
VTVRIWIQKTRKKRWPQLGSIYKIAKVHAISHAAYVAVRMCHHALAYLQAADLYRGTGSFRRDSLISMADVTDKKVCSVRPLASGVLYCQSQKFRCSDELENREADKLDIGTLG